jgi:hypothetical protein
MSNAEEEKKDTLSSMTIMELPKSTINVNRVSLQSLTLKDVDIFKDRKVIG